MTEQARLLGAALGADVEPFAQGGESRTFALRGRDLLVSVPSAWPDDVLPAAELERRATLLQRVEARVSIPVPHVQRVLPEEGLLVVGRLPGERLIDATPVRRGELRRPAAHALGTLLGELHTWDRAAYDDVAVVDDYSPEDWLQEAAATGARLARTLSPSQRRDVERFLSQPPPAPTAAVPVLSHNDLGVEHVLVAASGAPRVTGVIDWDDAAVCDPAHDFGLLLRDLGPDALDTALAAYAAAGGTALGIPARARFYARCKLLEDLAFGHAEGIGAYVEKSLDAWGWTFRAGPVD